MIQILSIVAALLTPSVRAEVLTSSEFLNQVQTHHGQFQASGQANELAKIKLEEAELLFEPQLQAQIQYLDDKKPNLLIRYSELKQSSYSLGISTQTHFGLMAKLGYLMTYSHYVGTLYPAFYEAKPSIELSFPLLRNRFAMETEAQSAALRNQVEAQRAGEIFRQKAILAEAEVNYWKLVAAREQVQIAKNTVDRASTLHNWAKRRVDLHLADPSDLYQAEAAEELRKIQFQAALDEERAQARAFNLSRNKDSDAVPETLEKLTELQQKFPDNPIRPAHTREDIQSAEFQLKAAQAQSKAAIERNHPNLDLFGTFALNSNNAGAGKAFTDSFSFDEPTWAVGVKYSTPLSFGASSRLREAYLKDQDVAEIQLNRKRLEEQGEWSELTARLRDAKKRLDQFIDLEKTQKAKVLHERDRLTKGRTITNQVLMFEEDFTQAQLNRIKTQVDILVLQSRLKLFGDIQ